MSSETNSKLTSESFRQFIDGLFRFEEVDTVHQRIPVLLEYLHDQIAIVAFSYSFAGTEHKELTLFIDFVDRSNICHGIEVGPTGTHFYTN